MARKVQKPDLNITLENPTQINAKKIANKKVMGIRVLNSSQRSQVYQGRDKISDAQSEIKDSQNQIDDTYITIKNGLIEVDRPILIQIY